MKLNENNSKFAIVKTAFHNGGTISFHNSLESALKAEKKNTSESCACGCCGIVPVTAEAKKEILIYRDKWNNPIIYNDNIPLYSDLSEYCANGEHYSQLCK